MRYRAGPQSASPLRTPARWRSGACAFSTPRASTTFCADPAAGRDGLVRKVPALGRSLPAKCKANLIETHDVTLARSNSARYYGLTVSIACASTTSCRPSLLASWVDRRISSKSAAQGESGAVESRGRLGQPVDRRRDDCRSSPIFRSYTVGCTHGATTSTAGPAAGSLLCWRSSDETAIAGCC